MQAYDPARRRLLGLGGASALGLLLGFHLHAGAQASTAEPSPFDAWIRILPDGRVALLVAKAEIGQGILTALSMVLGEELDVDWANVEVQQAPVDPSKYDHLTVGSSSVQSLWWPLRRAGARARGLLVRAAAERWKVPADACRTSRGSVFGPAKQRATYAELLAAALALTPGEPAVQLKPEDQRRIVGRPQRRVDAPCKVNGTAIYGIDVRRPGMLYAVLARCPTFGGRLCGFNADAALAVAGVKGALAIAPQGWDAFTRGAVAIVAENSWAALQGRRHLHCSWEPAGQAATSSSEAIGASLRRNAQQAGPVIVERGDTTAALGGAHRLVEATFELPFLAHAPLEPMNATVDVRAEAVEAWLPTQNAADARTAIARVLGRPPAAVTIHQTLVGGGFGRRDATDYVVEAAQVAAAVRSPLQLLWSREDDVQCGRYRPMATHGMRAALDARGFPSAWLDRMSSVSIAGFLEPPQTARPAQTEIGGALDLPYAVPAFRMEYTPVRCGVPVGWWRSVEDSLNAFAVECFIDELAGAAGRDPLSYRLALLSGGRRIRKRDGAVIETDRLGGVLAAVGAQADPEGGLPPGRARGLACHSCRGSYIAVVVEVSIPAPEVRVHHIWAAVDCGLAVNPLGLEAQIQGGLQFGTSAALHERITLQGGVVQQSNFNDYRVLRINESPGTTLLILPSRAPPSGAGEIAVPPVAPAIANAVFRLTGQRVRRLPVRAHSS